MLVLFRIDYNWLRTYPKIGSGPAQSEGHIRVFGEVLTLFHPVLRAALKYHVCDSSVLNWAGEWRSIGKQYVLGRSAYDRRLVCEALETRILLSGVPVLPAGLQATPIAVPYSPSSGSTPDNSPSAAELTPNQMRGSLRPGQLRQWRALQRDQLRRDSRRRPRSDDRHRRRLQRSQCPERPELLLHLLRPADVRRNRQSDIHQAEPERRHDPAGHRPSGPYNDGDSDWEQEESLDIEWAHVMAPMANIILFEANSNRYWTCIRRSQTAAKTSGVVAVSMSWSDTEFSGERVTTPPTSSRPSGHLGGVDPLGGADLPGGVTFLASAGDSGAYARAQQHDHHAQYPACFAQRGFRRRDDADRQRKQSQLHLRGRDGVG